MRLTNICSSFTTPNIQNKMPKKCKRQLSTPTMSPPSFPLLCSSSWDFFCYSTSCSHELTYQRRQHSGSTAGSFMGDFCSFAHTFMHSFRSTSEQWVSEANTYLFNCLQTEGLNLFFPLLTRWNNVKAENMLRKSWE